jgi:hypothetical protein
MSNRKLSASNLCLTMAAMFCAALFAGVSAAANTPATAQASAPAAAAPPLEQLDEIWVRGKRLAVAITDAENDVLALYNKLNKDYRYAVVCGYASINRSMILQRACMPNFVADALDASYPVAAYDTGSCYGGGANYGQAYNYGTSCQSAPAQVQWVTPPVEAIYLAHQKDYEAHVVSVVNSDMRLQQKYAHLVALREEMASTQQRFVQARKAHNDAIKPAKGPRAS